MVRGVVISMPRGELATAEVGFESKLHLASLQSLVPELFEPRGIRESRVEVCLEVGAVRWIGLGCG